MAGRIQRLEIFSAGTWSPGSGGSVTFTEQDLDKMVTNFAEFQATNIVKPHLKLGHTDAQKWFGQRNGVPSLGWVERVWREGAKLFADVRDVPDALLDLIRKGRYHAVSVEILPKVKKGEQTFSNVLSAIALLGAEMPAVKDLAGLAAALFSDEMQPVAFDDGTVPLVFSSSQPEKGMFTQEQVDSLIAAARQDERSKATQEFSAKVDGLNKQVEVLTARAEGAETKLEEATTKAAFASAEKLVDDAIKAGKLLPKQKDMAMAFATSTQTLKFGDSEKSQATLFSEFLDSLAPQVSTKEKGGSEGKERQTYATAAAEVDAKTREAITAAGGEAKLSYADAMNQVLAKDNDLRARYSAAV